SWSRSCGPRRVRRASGQRTIQPTTPASRPYRPNGRVTAWSVRGLSAPACTRSSSDADASTAGAGADAGGTPLGDRETRSRPPDAGPQTGLRGCRSQHGFLQARIALLHAVHHPGAQNSVTHLGARVGDDDRKQRPRTNRRERQLVDCALAFHSDHPLTGHLTVRRLQLQYLALEAEPLRAILVLPLVAVAAAHFIGQLAHRHRPAIGTEHPALEKLGLVMRPPDVLDAAPNDAGDAHLRVVEDLRGSRQAG